MSALQTLIDALALGALLALVAMGIGLVFGVMRLINFAHGELITAGAYTILLTKGWPVGARIVMCFVIVLALAVLMERGYRPLRGAAPVVMLVATFAVSFVLQNIALLKFGSRGENAEFLPKLNEALSIGDLRIRWITFVAIGVGILLLTVMALLLGRTAIGLQMRAAALRFETARLIGVRANTVILFAFVLAGILAAAVTVMLTIQRPLVTPGFGFFFVIPALVGIVVGGMDRLVTATAGGFAIGFASSVLADILPSDARVFLNSALFALVIVVLLVKPNGLFTRGREAVQRV